MKAKIEIDTAELKQIIITQISYKIGDMTFDPKKVKIEVKSKQNYKSEWEEADFRAIYEGDI
jgi:hypothetical protein